MSVLMSAGKKAMQARIAAQKLKEQKKRKASMSRENSGSKLTGEPPLSNNRTAVWYWQLNGVPTTVMYSKDTNEVWCNGYVLESMETFGECFECSRAINFGIYVEQLESIHDGKICCQLSSNGIDETYELSVDGYLIPEHTTPGLSVSVNTPPVEEYGAGCGLPPDFLTDMPPRYDDVYGKQPAPSDHKKQL